MSNGDERVLTPLFDRFVYGLFYPAILGANLLLLLERMGANYGFSDLLVWDDTALQFAWLGTLFIFVMDYMGTGTKEVDGAPKANWLLGFIALAAAVVFFYAQTKIVAAADSTTVNWGNLFWALLFLHILYVVWYVVRLVQSAGDDADKYHRYAIKQLCAVVIQFVVFGLLVFVFWPVTAVGYNVLVWLAVVGWIARQVIEYRHS